MNPVIEELLKQEINPDCNVYPQCSGCNYRHINYDNELQIKKIILQDLYIKNELNCTINNIVTCGDRYYRNNCLLKIYKDKFGFTNAETHHVIPFEECYILEKPIVNFLKKLREIKLSWHKINRIKIRKDTQDNIFIGIANKKKAEIGFEDIKEIIDLDIYGLINKKNLLFGLKSLNYNINNKMYRVTNSSFFQTNNKIAAEMNKYIYSKIKELDIKGCLLDIYSGIGLFGIGLADLFDSVDMIEISKEAHKDAIKNIKLNNTDNVKTFNIDFSEYFDSVQYNADTVIVDPSRKGLRKYAIANIIRMKPQFIFYVSCNPITMIDNIKIFVNNGYTILEVQPFDMFPRTQHIETIAILQNI